MKKALSLILVVALALGMLAALSGCKQSAEAPADTPVQAEPAAETSTGADETADAAQTLAPVTLKMVVLGGGNSEGNQKVYEELNKRLAQDVNATIEVSCISWDVWADEYPLLFASGEDIDMVYVASWAGYASHAQKGAFIELTTEMIQTYAPHARAAMTEEMWNQTKVDGKIYMIPQHVLNKDQRDFVLVRGDLREKYGLDEIETSDDLLAYWDAVLENENGILPFQLANISTDGVEGSGVYNLFVDNPYRSADYASLKRYLYTYDVSDPSNIQFADTSEYDKACYELMKQFREKGSWSQDALTLQTGNTDAFLAGTSATAIQAIGNISTLYSQVMEQHPEWKPEMIEMNKDDQKHLASVASNGMAIAATCKEPERVLMIYDLLTYDESYSNLICYGIEGVNYERVGENSYRGLTTTDDARYDSISGGLGNEDFFMDNVNSPANLDEMKADYLANSYSNFLDGVMFDDSEIKNEVAAVTAIDQKYATILRFGFSEDIEKDMADWAAEREAAGFAKIQAEYLKQAQAAYDSLNG